MQEVVVEVIGVEEIVLVIIILMIIDSRSTTSSHLFVVFGIVLVVSGPPHNTTPKLDYTQGAWHVQTEWGTDNHGKQGARLGRNSPTPLGPTKRPDSTNGEGLKQKTMHDRSGCHHDTLWRRQLFT